MRLLRVRSLSFRLALVYIGLFTASVTLLVSAYYGVSIWRPLDETREAVRREMAMLSNLYILDGEDALLKRLAQRTMDHHPRKAFHTFLARDGAVVLTNLPSWPATPSNDWAQIEADIYADGDEEDHHALVLDRVFDDGARLIVGRDIEDIDEREETLASAAAWLVGLAVLLGVAGGALMSVAIGRRIEGVTATARRVMGGDLSGRIALHGSGDDFDQLGEALNLMLARIETLVESVRRVSDSVAHELRTPLARLQADLEDLAAAEMDAHERHRLIAQALLEAERLQSTFDALLRIAQIETGNHKAGMRNVDLTALLNDAAELHQPHAELKAISLTTNIAAGLRLRGDPDLLFQAISNLLDNAIKYTPQTGAVSLAADLQSDRLTVTISDTGPGISPEYRARITERFFRAPGTEQHPGVGLGLSLVAAVASLHQANLVFGGDEAGACVTWSMPVPA